MAWLEPAEIASDGLLFLMLLAQWTTSDQTLSTTLAVIWLLWSLALGALREGSHRWRSAQWPLALILVLNLRGLIYQEGTQPVSHMDYIIIIAAFVAGIGRSPKRWISSISAILAAGIAGFLLNLNPFIKSFTAIANGTANVSGWHGQDWGGQYFRAGEMSVNQTACLTGITLTLGLCAWARSQGLTRRVAVLASILMAAMAFATGSRLALLLSPMAAVAGMVIASALNPGSSRAWMSWMRRRAAVPITIGTIAVGLILFQPGRAWLLQNYFSRKLSGDQGRLDALGCYLSLPFSDGSRWALGVGYGEAWKRFCDEDVGITISHAHNFIAQLAGETGLISSAAVLIALAALWLPLLRRSPIHGGQQASLSADPQRSSVQAYFSAAFLYLLVFALLELAFLKVTVLECLIGYLLAMSYCGKTPQAKPERLQQITTSTAP
jgi:hypothetical protein